MNTQPQDIAWRHILLDIPRDPQVVYGGTIGIGKVSRTSVAVMNQIQYLQPIAQKRESEEVQLLRQLVQQRKGGQAPPMMTRPPGLRLEHMERRVGQLEHRIPV